MSVEFPIESDPRYRRLADYLASKAPPGKLPGRQHIDPLDFADLLPYVALVDVISQAGSEPRYRVRLMGTEVVAIQGKDGTGKYVEELLTDPEGIKIIRDYSEILRTRQPQFRRGVIATPGRQHVHYERVAFPLATDGENVDMLLFLFARSQPKPI